MNKSILVLLTLGILMYACTHDAIKDPIDDELRDLLDQHSPTGSFEYYQFPDSDDFSSIPHQDVKNPITADKVELGKLLFHETAMGTDAAYPLGIGSYSCASCHIAANGFTPGRMQGLADGGLGFGDNRNETSTYGEGETDSQGARPLSILNVAYVTNTLWSGLFGSYGVNEGTEEYWDSNPDAEVNFKELEGLEAQNIEGLQLHRMEITDELLDVHGYRALFDECFPEIPEDERYSLTTASFALGAYLRTILAQKAPFQNWLRGEEYSMSTQEKRGAVVFLSKAHCTKCHNGPSFNSMSFHALGTPDLFEHANALNTDSGDPRNLGRAFFTGQEEDNNRFKVPQLYNLKDYTHFFHGSSKETLEEVLDYKIAAQSENPRVSNDQLSSYFRPIDLTEEEKADLLTFLKNGLRDPDLERYVPESILSGNCFPNNDVFSRIELGCE